MNSFLTWSLKRSLSPLIVSNWIFGVDVFEHPDGKRHPIVSAFWVVLHLAFAITTAKFANLCNALGNEHSNTREKRNLLRFIYNIIQMLVIFYYSKKKSQTLHRCLDKIQESNEALRNMSINVNYQRMFKIQMLNIVTSFTIMVLFVSFSSYRNGTRNADDKYEYMIALAHYSHGSAVYLVVVYSFATYVRFIGQRFRDLNVDIQDNSPGGILFFETQLSDVDHRVSEVPSTNTSLTFSRRGFDWHGATNSRKRLQYVREARRIHRDLCKIAETINEVYGVQLMFLIPQLIIVIGHVLFLLHKDILWPISTSTNSCYWIIVEITIRGYVSRACTKTSDEARRTTELLSQVCSPTASQEIKAEIRCASLQLMRNPLQFTVNRLAPLNKQFFLETVASLVTYLVFVVQLPIALPTATKLENGVIVANTSTIWTN